MAIDVGNGRRIGPSRVTRVSPAARRFQQTIAPSTSTAGAVRTARSVGVPAPELRPLVSKLPAVFTAEGPGLYSTAFSRNRPLAVAGSYQTTLSHEGEIAFRRWAARAGKELGINIPISGKSDYDYRGFFAKANGTIPHGHFPDTFKTPMDTTFSAESKYAAPNNPLHWQGDRLLNTRTGRRIFG